MANEQNIKLNRTISLSGIIFYGVGTMVGGGIYALIGKVAGEAGMYAPLAFGVASILAIFTAFSYAELSARYPYSSGEAHYVQNAYGKDWLTKSVGWLVILMGIVSSAALTNAGVGFLTELFALPDAILTLIMVAILTSFAIWGISQSVMLVTIITLVEVGGLLFVIFTSSPAFETLPSRWNELFPPINDMSLWICVISGAFLAFYAFIGFEDMVNIAEEVKDVKKNMPIAVISCIVITFVLYGLISVVSVLSVDPNILATSNSPLALVMQNNGNSIAGVPLTIIGVLAVANGALVQIIMASRVIYGLASQNKAPQIFKKISKTTHTPIPATFVVAIFILLLALFFDLTTLAKITSLIILFVFALINASLLKIKISEDTIPKDTPYYPNWIAWVGLISSVAMLCFGFFNKFLSYM